MARRRLISKRVVKLPGHIQKGTRRSLTSKRVRKLSGKRIYRTSFSGKFRSRKQCRGGDNQSFIEANTANHMAPIYDYKELRFRVPDFDTASLSPLGEYGYKMHTLDSDIYVYHFGEIQYESGQSTLTTADRSSRSSKRIYNMTGSFLWCPENGVLQHNYQYIDRWSIPQSELNLAKWGEGFVDEEDEEDEKDDELKCHMCGQPCKQVTYTDIADRNRHVQSFNTHIGNCIKTMCALSQCSAAVISPEESFYDCDMNPIYNTEMKDDSERQEPYDFCDYVCDNHTCCHNGLSILLHTCAFLKVFKGQSVAVNFRKVSNHKTTDYEVIVPPSLWKVQGVHPGLLYMECAQNNVYDTTPKKR